jgi:Spx/MgsR family transcriptional regulator
MTIMFGIKNCDTIKKAKNWLEQHQISFEFHDYRQQGLEITTLQAFCDALGYEVLLNTRGTTWRGLAQEQKENIDQAKAIALMLEFPALIKRPVLHHHDQYLCGFTVNSYANFFKISE